jgi:hypothetical protein
VDEWFEDNWWWLLFVLAGVAVAFVWLTGGWGT